MKKVKITVLKTTLDRELAAEYGVEGLTACPMMRAGQVFYADYTKPDGLCDEAWKAIYQYVFPWLTGWGRSSSITATGSGPPAWPFAVVTTGSAPSSSSWRPLKRRLRWSMRPSDNFRYHL